MLQPPVNTDDSGKTNGACSFIKLLAAPKLDQPRLDTGFLNSYAVVIGINDYQSGIPKLRTAVNDAKAIAEILKRDHGYTLIVPSARADQEQSEAWLDQDATVGNLNALFEDLGKRIGKGDRLLFYFAGHGIALNSEDGPQGFLIPQDANYGDINTYLPMSQVRNALEKLNCKHRLIILDCCYSGAFRWCHTRQFGHVKEIFKDNFDSFVNSPTWQVITSSAHDQTAADVMVLKERDFGDAQHSPFASALIEALTDEAVDTYPPAQNGKPAGDGIITADELYQHLRYQVELKTAQNNKRQTPGLWIVDENYDKGVYFFLTKRFGGKDKLNGAPKINDQNNPYRGLESYGEKDSELFFGRTQVIEDLCDHVCDRPLTVVLGASGSGKSSLVKAGLIPHLQRSPSEAEHSQIVISNQKSQTHKHKHQQWTILAPIRPGNSPATELDNVLQLVNLDDLPSGTKLLLVIDQFEEVVTQCSNQQEREAFFQRLSQLLEKSATSDTLRIVLTLRLDFEPQLRTSVEVKLKKYNDLTRLLHAQKPKQLKTVGSNQQPEEQIWDAARFIVRPMTREELQEAIEAPATIKAIQFDQNKQDNCTLAQKLIHEVADMPGALPLLSFTLRELYRKLAQRFIDAQCNGGTPPDRTITWADYNALGGVARALTRRATEEYDNLAKDEQGKPLDKSEAQARQRVLRWLMLRMVALDGGEIARRRVISSELEYPNQQDDKRCQKIIDHLSSPSVRLLVQGTNLERKDYVEPAHDALVREWDKIKAWLEGEKEQACAAIDKADSSLQPQIKQKILWDWCGIGNKFRRNRKLNQKSTKFNLELQRDLMDAASRWQDARATQKTKQTLQTDKWVSKQENADIEEKQDKQMLLRDPPKISIISKSKRIYNSLFSEISNWLWWNDPRLPLAKEVFDSSDNWLNALEAEFLQESITTRETRRKFQLYLQRVVTAVILIAALFAWANRERAKIEQIRALRQSSEANLRSNQNLDALMASLQAGKILEESWLLPLLDNRLKDELTETLQKAVYAVRERNRLKHSEQASKVTVRFSPDGQLIATAGDDGTIAVWNLQEQKLSGNLEKCQGENGSQIWDIDFSSNNQMLAAGGEEGVVRFCTFQDDEIAPWNPDVGWITSVRFSPDGQLIAAAGTGGAAIWNIQKNSLIRLEKIDQVYSIAFSLDSQFIATGTCARSASVWNLQGRKLRESQNSEFCIRSISFSPDSQFIAFTGDWDLTHLWKWQDGSNSYKLPNLLGPWGGWGIDFNPSNNQSLAVARNDGSIYLLNLQGDIQKTLRSSDSLHKVSFSPDGQLVAAAGDNGNISLWNLDGDQQVVQLNSNQKQMNQDRVKSIRFASDSRTVATITENGTAHWWNLQGNLIEDNREVPPANNSCDLEDRGMQVKTGDESNLDRDKAFVYALQGNLLAETSRGHTNGLTSISCTVDGNLLATVGTDYKVRLWNLSQLQLQEQAPQSLFPVREWTGDDDVISFVQFSPNGKQLATGGSARGRGRVRLWTLEGTALATWETNQGSIREISFSPDGKLLATVGNEGNPTLLPIESFDELMGRGCAWVRDYLATLDDDNSNRHLCKGINSSDAAHLGRS